MQNRNNYWLLILISCLYLGWNIYLFAQTNTEKVPDTGQYKYVATLSILSTDFWLDWRPTTTPLLFKILGNNDTAIVHAQFLIGLASWLILASGVVVNLRRDFLKVIGFAAVLFMGSGTDFILVYRMLSTEGIAYSLTAMVIGAWLWTVAYLRDHPNLTRRQLIQVSAALMGVIFFWAASRYPHSFVSLATISLLSLIVVLRWRKLGQWRVVLPIIILASLAVFLFESIPVSQSDYWKQGFMNALAEKVLPDPDKVEFFAERGMPTSPEAMKYAGYVPARYAGPWEPIFDEWLENGEARRAYFVDYLVLRPVPRLVELSENWEKVFSPNIPLWFFSRKSADAEMNGWQTKVHYLYYDPGSFTYLLGMIPTLILFVSAVRYTRRLEWRFLVPLIVLLLSLPAAYMNWYGDAYYERVFIGVSLQLKIGVVLLALFSMDSWLTLPHPLTPSPKGEGEQANPNSPLPSATEGFAVIADRAAGNSEGVGSGVRLKIPNGEVLKRATIFVILALAIVEILFGVVALRNQIAYPILSSLAPNTNFFRYWDVSDLEYRVYQEAPIGEPVMSLQQNIIDGQVYYREYMVYWVEGGAHGELRDDDPNDTVELAWRNTPVSYDRASPAGPVFGGHPFNERRGSALKQWQGTRLPANLLDAGIHYLQVDTAVWETLPAYQVGVLRNPDFYELVSKWTDDEHTAPQHLYRIIGDVRDWTPPPAYTDAPLALSEEIDAAYQAHPFDLIEDDVVIFNPATGEAFSRQTEISQLAAVIAYTQPNMKTLASLFDLLTILERMQFEEDLEESLTDWRNSKLPEDLVGIDYLFFEATWASWLPDEERAILSDPQNYELVAEWFGETPKRYILLRVVGS